MIERTSLAESAAAPVTGPRPISADHLNGVMLKTLESALSRSQGRTVRIIQLDRAECQHESTFHGEHLFARLENGESLRVFLKDLSPQHQIEQARKVRRSDVPASNHELRVYQIILSRLALGTPELYASRWDPERGIYWMFLEDTGSSRLRDSRNFVRWVPAAQWAARFHAATRNLPAAQTSFLPSYDAAHFRHCAARIQQILPTLESKDRELVERAYNHYESRIDWLDGLSRSVIHCQFFGKNIMLRPKTHKHHIAVIDWETAALGPSSFDLASVSSGRWTARERESMWRAYFDQYQAETHLVLNWDSFCLELKEMELYQALEWLGWWRNRSVSHNFGIWVKELERIMKDHPAMA
jgi:aminoglycoside/choline kinase family phosphotransferase